MSKLWALVAPAIQTTLKLLAVVTVVAVLAAISWRVWSRHVDQESAQDRATQEAQARDAGIPVVDQVSPAEVAVCEQQMVKDDPIAAAEIKRLRKQVGALRTELVIRARTAGAPVNAPPPPETPPTTPDPRPVALYQGDRLILGADLALEKGDKGAHMIVGSLSANRADGFLLSSQPYSAPVTIAKEVAPAVPASSRAAFGPILGLDIGDGIRPVVGLQGETKAHKINLPLIPEFDVSGTASLMLVGPGQVHQNLTFVVGGLIR